MNLCRSNSLFRIGTCVMCKQGSTDLDDVWVWVKRPITVMADPPTEMVPMRESHSACGKCREEHQLEVVM